MSRNVLLTRTQFVLQGDFILGANREDILHDNAWNKAILTSTIDLFLKSIHIFNSRGVVKYTWPRFLISQGNAFGTAFQDFLSRLIKRLKVEPVIESLAMTFEPPKSLHYVPPEFTDASDPPKPLLDGGMGIQAFPSHGYHPQDLAPLGLRVQTAEVFLSLLSAFVEVQYKSFRQQPQAWHSQLARAVSLLDRARVRELKLVPLKGDVWVSASATALYFNETEGGLHNAEGGMRIPDGISVNTIAENAAKDGFRFKLYRELGARRLTSAEVYKLIVDQHQSHNSAYGTWDVDSLVEHAWCLFRLHAQPKGCDIRHLWLAPQRSPFLQHGADLYMDSSESGFRISEYFGADTNVIRYIHERYLSRADSEGRIRIAEWHKWLKERLHINTVLRLASAGSISPEFQYIIDNKPGNEWMQLLKAQWGRYSRELSAPGGLQDVLSKAKARCTDGQVRQLKEMYLATGAITAVSISTGRVPMLAVDDPLDEGWLKFSALGLNINPNLRFYLSILRNMKTSAPTSYVLKDVQRVYGGIARFFLQDAKLVRYVNSAVLLESS